MPLLVAPQVKEWMHRQSGVPMEDLEAHVFLLRDRDATQHLMEVAGGLDSLIKGEGQILAQVRLSLPCAGPHWVVSGSRRHDDSARTNVPVVSQVSLNMVIVNPSAAPWHAYRTGPARVLTCGSKHRGGKVSQRTSSCTHAHRMVEGTAAGEVLRLLSDCKL